MPAAELLPPLLPPPAGPPREGTRGWTVERHRAVVSTNDLAARRPAWTVVVAAIQTGGRGRHARRWVSDAGGLWFSAVLPTPGPAARWSILPLAVGWAVWRAARDLGVARARLRWPNDLMVGQAKLGGILVERFHPENVVAGIGLNLDNRPENADGALAGQTTRLADLLAPPPSADRVLAAVLQRLAEAHGRVAAGHWPDLCAELNGQWAARRVRVEIDDGTPAFAADFLGIDEAGAIRLRTPAGRLLPLDALRVRFLRELS